MSYAPLPAEHPPSISWQGSVSRCLCHVGIAGLFCIVGSQGFLGKIGNACSAAHWGPDYAHQFLGGGGEGYLREYLGELGIVFCLVAESSMMIVQAQQTLLSVVCLSSVCLSVVTIVAAGLLVAGQGLVADRSGVVICSVVLLGTTVCDALLKRFADKSDDQRVLKRIAIIGGLIVFLARQTVSPTAVSPYWPVMFGRLVLLLPILNGVVVLGRSTFQTFAARLGLPWPTLVGVLVFIGCIFGCMVNFLGALTSSFICDLAFTLHIFGCDVWIIIAQGTTIPPAEVLIVLLITYTVVEHIWPFVFGPSAERWQHWQEMIENGAVVGGLTYLSGSDAWSV